MDPVIKGLDQVVQAFSVEGTTSAAHLYTMQLKTSVCFQVNISLGSATWRHSSTRPEVAMRNELGVNNMMWATDYPHQESTVP